MSRRARTYREAYEAKHNPDAWEFTWQDERDTDDDELPEPDSEPLPIHTTH